MTDPRLHRPTWDASARPDARLVGVAIVANVLLAGWYLTWLLQPGRAGHPVLYGLLIVAEAFNLAQAAGFWWIAASDRRRRRPATPPDRIDLTETPTVDVFIPVYNEPVQVVEATVAAATRLTGADVRVAILDDGDQPAMEALASRYGVRLIRRVEHGGAKAGNINHALAVTSAQYVAVFDCDHVPDQRFLDATLGHFSHERVALVQTPQYYANERTSAVAAAASAQQKLFFGVIARGKAAQGSMFCCGTNVVFRRTALVGAGGFPEDSLTEDFALSIRLHETGWESRYVAEVLASGLGPEDMASYVSQQRRWAQGCLGAVTTLIRSRLSFRRRLQYLGSSIYFLTGWTLALYMTLPVLRIVTGAQPLTGVTADQFLLHFAPYFLASLATVVVASGGAYTFSALALAAATYGVHIRSTVRVLMRRRGRFVVTPKQGSHRRQLRPVAATLVTVAVLLAAVGWGLARSPDAATLNNIAYALIHVAVLSHGIRPALVGGAALSEAGAGRRVVAEASTEQAV